MMYRANYTNTLLLERLAVDVNTFGGEVGLLRAYGHVYDQTN
jgi:hypothetical protein